MLSAAEIEYSASSKQFKSFTPLLKVSLQQFTCFILDFLSFYLLFEMVLHELIISRMLKSTLQLIGELYKLREEGSSFDVCLVGIDGKTHVHLPVLIAANPWLGDIIDDCDQVHVIIMPDYSALELESFVDRLYCHTPVPPDDPSNNHHGIEHVPCGCCWIQGLLPG